MNEMNGSDVDMGANDGMNIQGDWNTDDEYAPPPLAQEGFYTGNITEVGYDPSAMAIVWTVTLSGNDDNLVMTDGNTPINGQQFQYRNWLPKPGDESIYTKTGRMTKRQAKINMLKEFADNMKIDMSTPDKVRDAVMGGDWIGISVQAHIGLRTYQGRTSNEVKKLVALDEPLSTGGDDIPF